MERDDPMYEYFSQIEKAEHDVANLFTAISKELDEDEARRIFNEVLKRQRGRRATFRSKNIDGFLLMLHKLGVTNIAEFAYKWKMVHSVEAANKRIKRLLKKARDK